MLTTNSHEPLHTDSHHADHTRKMTIENMRLIDAARGHRAQEHVRWWRWRLWLRPVGGYGRCGCAGWQVGTQGRSEAGQIMRMRRKGGEFEALRLLRTLVGGPAAAQWAMAGGAPAPQLNDRSPPRPQRGNGREQ